MRSKQQTANGKQPNPEASLFTATLEKPILRLIN